MNSKGYGRKRSWPNLMYYSGFLPGGTEGNYEKNSHDSQSPGQDMNPGPPGYEAGLLTIPRRSRNPMVDCLVHVSPPVVTILGHMNPRK
jgi:hypothetical protein